MRGRMRSGCEPKMSEEHATPTTCGIAGIASVLLAFLVIGPAANGLESCLGTLPRIASLFWVALLDGAVDACNTRCLS